MKVFKNDLYQFEKYLIIKLQNFNNNNNNNNNNAV